MAKHINSLDLETKEPEQFIPTEDPIVEKPVEKAKPVPKVKKVVGYKITKRDGKVIKSEPIYS